MEIEGTTDTTVTTDAEPTQAEPQSDVGTAEPDKPAWQTRIESLLDDEPADVPTDEGGGSTEEGADERNDAAAADDDAAGEEAPEVEAETGEGGAEEDADDAADGAPVVRLPGRMADDPDVEIKVTPKLREALEEQGLDPDQYVQRTNQLRNEGLRRRQFEEAMVEVEADRQELQMIERELAERPAEFLTEKIGANLLPDVAKAVLLRLPDAEFERLLETVSEWDNDPSTRRTAAAEARETSVSRREQMQAQSTAARQRQGFVRDVAGQIVGLVPEDMDEAKANEFFDFAVYKLDQWSRSQPQGTRLDPAQVPSLLDQLGVLAPYGLSTNDQAARASARDVTSETRRATRPADDPELAERAKRTGQDLKRREQKRKLAATAPAGAGAAAADFAPPKGQSFKERMSWLERKLGLG